MGVDRNVKMLCCPDCDGGDAMWAAGCQNCNGRGLVQVAPRVLNLGQTMIRIWPEYVETVFPGGAKCPAAPHDTDEYRTHARELGYGDDVARMSREHELLHTLLAVDEGLPWSPTLFGVAHPDEAPPIEEQHAEESRVLQMQRVLNKLREVAA